MPKPATGSSSAAEAPVLSGGGGVDTDRLMRELGQFRRFHVTNYCLISLVTITAAIYSVNYVFLAADVPYR